MRALENLPIKWKLMLAMLATSMTAVLLLGSALFFAGLLHLRNLEVQKAAALAGIVGGDCASALEHKDAKAAQEKLAEVAANPAIGDACLYTTDGQLLARYTRGDLMPQPPPPVCESGESFAGDRLMLCRPIKHDGRMVGTVYLRTDTRIVWARLRNYVGMGILVMGISMLVALVFAHRLQRFLSVPILELVRVAEGVAERKDFTLRAAKLSHDETGLLADAFNRMLGLIQEHDSGSRASQSRLEKRVAERTAELRKVNENLRESEARFRAVLENSVDLVYRRNIQTDQYDFFSPAVESITGFSAGELLGKSVNLALEFVHPDDVVVLKRMLERARAGDQTGGTVEYRFKHKNGNYRWLSDRFSVLKDDSGHPLYWVGVSRDVTEIKQVAEALQQSEERFRTVFEQATDGFLLADVETKKFILSNPRMCQMLGYSADELKNLSVSDIHPAEDVPWIIEMFTRQTAGETMVAPEVPVQRKDGTVFYADINSQTVIMDGKKSLLGIFRDITDRKQAKEALQHRLAIEHLVASVSSRLANTTSAEADTVINEVLANLGQITQTDRCYLFSVSHDLTIADNTHEWCAPGVRSQIGELRDVPTAAFPWYLKQLRDGEPLLLPRVANLPAEAKAERRLLQPDSVQSVILVPIRHAGALVGFIGCDVVRAEHNWSDEDARLLRTIGELVTDAVARLQVEETLRRSEAHLQVALDAAQLAPWQWNIVTGEIPCSQQCLALYGLPADTVATYERFLQTIHPDDREHLQIVLREAIEKHTEYAIEKRVLRPDGLVIWVAARGRCYYDADGRPLHITGVSYDITARKLAEEMQWETLQRLELATRAANVGLWEWDLTTGRGYASPIWKRQLGYAEDEIPSLHEGYEKRLHPEDHDWVMEADRRFFESSETQLEKEFRMQHKDGSYRWILSRAELKRDAQGKPLHIVGLHIDITDRKRAEEVQRKTLHRLELATNAANAGLWELDLTTREGWLSPIWKQQLGYASHELSNRFEEFESRLHPEDHDWVLERERRFAESSEKQIELEFRLRHKDGSYRWILSRAEAERDTQGKPLRMIGLHIDITDRKRAEEALTKLNETLEQRVAERTDSLRQSEEKFHRIAGHIHDVLYSVDMETQEFRYLSPAFKKMFGYTEEDIRNMGGRNGFLKQVIEKRAVSVEEQALHLEQLKTKPEPGVAFHSEECWRCKDGTLKSIEDRWIPVYASGRLVSTEGLLCDITERKRLEDQLLAISEREQRRIGQDLHDGLCQHLAGVGFMSKALAQKLAHTSPVEAAEARAVANLIRQAINDARGIAAGLHPVKKEANGAMVALQELAANIENMFKIKCVFCCDPPVLIEDNDTAVHLYRIAQEAANNAIRHGKAGRVWITLAEMDHHVTLTVKDNGKGIPQPLPVVRGIGIEIMNHRARMIGGALDIRRAPKKGTILTCSFLKKTAT